MAADFVQYVATVHALDRFEERWPDEAGDDVEMATIMQSEVEAALREGRHARMFPRRMNGSMTIRPVVTPGTECVWTPDMARGYVISDRGRVVHIVTAVPGDGIA